MPFLCGIANGAKLCIAFVSYFMFMFQIQELFVSKQVSYHGSNPFSPCDHLSKWIVLVVEDTRILVYIQIQC